MLLLPVDRNGAKSKGELSVVICARTAALGRALHNPTAAMEFKSDDGRGCVQHSKRWYIPLLWL